MEKDIVFIRNMILTVAFAVFLGYNAHNTEALHNLADIVDVVFPTKKSVEAEENYADVTKTQKNKGKILADCLNDVSENINDLLPYQEKLVNLSGALMRVNGVKDYYNPEYGINVTTSNYVISQVEQTSTDYEVSQMIQLTNYLDEHGIRLLYVNEPAKYIDDDIFRNEFSAESYLNRNADLFLKRLSEAQIEYIDLRENIREEGLDCHDLFYRADHHWTVPTSKWAAEIIAEKLNDDYGYDIDLNLYADENFNYVEYENCWLGEQGRKLAESYIGMENFTLIVPTYDTSFSRNINGEYTEGDFNIFIDYSVYSDSYDMDWEFQPAKLKGWHYSYNGDGYIQNNNADFGNVLIFGDSYERTLIPFMSLGIRNIYKIEPRYMNSTDIQAIIESGDYDTVIITYAQFMIGAHDNPDNSNYGMFTFFEDSVGN